MAHVVRYDLAFWDVISKEDSRRMIEEEWKRHHIEHLLVWSADTLSHHCSRMLDLFRDARCTIPSSQSSNCAARIRGNLWIWNSNVAEWLTLIDGIAGANLQNDALLTFLFISTCLDILWIGGDGWSHESTWKRGDFCESVHGCQCDWCRVLQKTGERCGPCWCWNVDSCRYGKCHDPNLDMTPAGCCIASPNGDYDDDSIAKQAPSCSQISGPEMAPFVSHSHFEQSETLLVDLEERLPPSHSHL